MTFIATAWEWLHSQPSLAKFALGMAIIVGILPLSRRARLPAVVGLLLSGVVLGPHVLGLFGEHAPIADFFAELGKLLLMFFAGLEIDIAQFRRERNKSVIFGLVTTLIPLLLGTAVGLLTFFVPIATGSTYNGTHQACGTGQQFARGPAGRFRTTRWSVVLFSAQNAAEGRLGP